MAGQNLSVFLPSTIITKQHQIWRALRNLLLIDIKMTWLIMCFFCLFKTIKIFLMYFFAISPFFLSPNSGYIGDVFSWLLWITLIADQETFHARHHKAHYKFQNRVGFCQLPFYYYVLIIMLELLISAWSSSTCCDSASEQQMCNFTNWVSLLGTLSLLVPSILVMSLITL